jgi:holliday junction DNA helicase RuvB
MEPSAPAEDVGQVRLQTLSHIRGLPQVISVLVLYLQGYFAAQSLCGTSSTAAGPFLLTGPSGLGKTMVAKVVHTEVGNLTLIETSGQTLNSTQELFLTLIRADANTTIFIDEAQAMGPQAQHILLTALSEGVLRVPARFCSTYSHSIQLAPFTMILATTHEYLLQDALRNRMRVYCRFDYYPVADLIEIVRQYAETLEWGYQCDALGLDQLDRSYLEILLKHGPTAANVVASRLLLPSLTLQRVVEPYLLRTELITKDRSSRRAITEQGRRHIENDSL